MNNIRLFFGLTLLLLALLIIKFITRPYAPENVLLQVPGAMGVVLTGLVWGLVIWFPMRLVRGVGRVPDMQRFVFSTAVIVSIIFVIYQASQ